MDNGASSYRRFLNGDENAFSEIVVSNRTGLSLYINSIVKNIDTAEELTENVFVKLYLKRPKDRAKCSFKTWLYTIGRNMAIDYLRKQKKENALSLEETPELKAEEKTMEERYIAEENKKALYKALKCINPEYAAALRLMYFEDFTVAEIAFITKKSTKSTYDTIYRAKKSLKNQLIKEGFTYEI